MNVRLIPPQRNQPQSIQSTTEPGIICLGRFGDIINALPISWDLAKNLKKPVKWLVSEQFSHILSGCSYVDPIIFKGDYSHQEFAKQWAKDQGQAHKWVACSSHGGKDFQRETGSYQTEGWRIAGYLKRFGELPTVFDRRNPDRERSLVESLWTGKPVIMVNSDSVSSPIAHMGGLHQAITDAFPDFTVLDMSKIRVTAIFDLLGLMDRAKLLISVDSMQLHLAKASRLPVISIINDKWKGSVPPPGSIKAFRYQDVTVQGVVEAAKSVLVMPDSRLFHCVSVFGQSERHERAQKSWEAQYSGGMRAVHVTKTARDATSLGDNRKLPFLKDILKPGMDQARDFDVIFLTNDDIELSGHVPAECFRHVILFGAASWRRIDSNGAAACGRDAMMFRKDWLIAHWDELGDPVLGESQWDLHWACVIRKSHGIISTISNIAEDVYPAETDAQLALHESHTPEWTSAENEKAPGKVWNAGQFQSWRKKSGINFW